MADWTDNPFAESTDDPFADPAVSKATKKTSPKVSTSDYDPFGEAPAPGPAPAAAAPQKATSPDPFAESFGEPAPKPAPSKKKSEPADPFGGDSSSSSEEDESESEEDGDPFDQDSRSKEYDQRAARQAGQLKDPNLPRRPNFPKIPLWLKKNCSCLGPCYHIDMDGEIPLSGRPLLKKVYRLWQFHFVCCFFFFVTFLAMPSVPVGLVMMFIVLLCCPCCFFACNFIHIYTAMRKDSDGRYLMFFMAMSFQLMFTGFMMVAPNDAGAYGLIQIGDAEGGFKTLVGINAGLWGLNLLFSLYLVRKTLLHFKTQGKSIAGAQAEFEQAKNDVAKKAAKDAASSAFSNA